MEDKNSRNTQHEPEGELQCLQQYMLFFEPGKSSDSGIHILLLLYMFQ
jgi:hypothetical protein